RDESRPGAPVTPGSRIIDRLLARGPDVGTPRWYTIVLITPAATVVTNRARISPLTDRKPAFGLSARRRAAMSVAGRRVRLARIRAPVMVSQGPAMTSPAMTTRKPGRNARTCAAAPGGTPTATQ